MVSVRIEPDPFGAKVIITDNGIGISSKELSKIFDKFYRVKSDGKMIAPGKGLGLAVVKSLTEGQGGRVIVQSTINVGSTFIVELKGAAPKYQNVHFLNPTAAKG
jgi:signal transduction histidine kinase